MGNKNSGGIYVAPSGGLSSSPNFEKGGVSFGPLPREVLSILFGEDEEDDD